MRAIPNIVRKSAIPLGFLYKQTTYYIAYVRTFRL